MLPNKPPYFYKCKSCGEIFSSKRKGMFTKLLSEILDMASKPPICEDPPPNINNKHYIDLFSGKAKCPKCGSKKVREIPFSKWLKFLNMIRQGD